MDYHHRRYAHLGNVVFLGKVGDTLRQATSDIAQEDLPEDIKLLVRRLERLEEQERRKHPPSANSTEREPRR